VGIDDRRDDPASGSPRPGVAGWLARRYDSQAQAAMVCLVVSAVLVFLSVGLPGYVRDDARAIFTGIGVIALVLAGATAWFTRLTTAQASVVMLFGDVAIVVAVACTEDRAGGQILASLLVLPMLFVAIFMDPRYLKYQFVLVSAAALAITGMGTADVATMLLRAGIVVVAATCPAVFILILRAQLAGALRHARQLATTDALTGLVNRRGLEDRMPEVVARACRSSTPVGVLLVDVDHFKRVNDTHGHAVGDDVLRCVAGIIRRCVRGDDVVVRLGGEEMAIVTSSGAEGLVGLAERLRREVETGAAKWAVTVSIGVATGAPCDREDPGLLWALVDEADELMYEAKRAGRNQVRVRRQPELSV
jgi:diguanylate cyclase (GGDEF)-like protein